MTTTALAGACAPAARPGPTWPADWDRVLDTAIRTWRGEWTTARVQLLFKVRYGQDLHRADARAFLSRRAHQGVLRLHNRPDARYYTLARTTRGDHK
ncbi:hypothetical protein [Streptomyces scabiei]|uniref:hypothetical protein n=1 Tax=Streptomyces scabiei TaxID=1930 RepID=UPI000765E561|nr:hypothetical protein [Streptomyces scabiei]